MEEKNKAYATFEERDRIASLGGGTAKIEKYTAGLRNWTKRHRWVAVWTR